MKTKKLLLAATVAALVGSPAFAASTHHSPRGAGTGHVFGRGHDAPSRAFAAVTGAASERPASSARGAALRDCSGTWQKYSEYTWGDMEIFQWRACMAGRGQPE
jgi:hypothetical protein